MTTQKPNLLYLVHRFPCPPNRGDRIRSFHLLKYLQQQYNVYLGTLWDEEPEEEHWQTLHRLCHEVAAFPVGRWSRWLRAAQSLASGQSATVGLFRSEALQQQVDLWLRDIQFDVAVVFCSSMVQYISTSQHIATIVDLVDVDSQKWFDYASRANGPKRWLFNLEGNRLRQLERSLPQRSQAITLVSEAEAQLFREICPNDMTHGINNGVDLEYFQPDTGSESNGSHSAAGPVCTFVGALDYRANIQAMEWFCEHCWPGVRQQIPNATLELVGRNPAQSLLRLSSLPGVAVIGSVPDVRPYLQRANVVIAPLQTARGVQNKVLEAMAVSKAVVASRQAIEGLDCRIGQDLLSADTADAWVATLVRLLNDRRLCQSIGRAGREYVQLHHCWSETLAEFGRLLPDFTTRIVSEGLLKPEGLTEIKPEGLTQPLPVASATG